jgi:C-terminal processing protease CtpA/Prc
MIYHFPNHSVSPISPLANFFKIRYLSFMSFLKSPKFKLILKIFLILLIFALGGIGGYFYNQKLNQKSQSTTPPKDKYIAFFDEAYTIIKENYWNKLEDEQLNKIFVLGTDKLTGTPTQEVPKTKDELLKFLEKTLKNYQDDQKKKEFTVTLSDVVLSNLEPFGRSRLYTQKDEKALADTVQNKNLESDHYATLSLPKDASQSAIEIAYKEMSEKWDPKTNKDPQAPQKYEEIQQAYKILSDAKDKELYDKDKIEPTMDYKMVSDNVFYIHLKKFSPTTVEELNRVTQKIPNPNADTLIFDLSDNIGGLIDGLPYFLGPFIGPDQYAYQFFHQGEKEDFKTKTTWLVGLVPFKKVIIMINGKSQSSAEVMAATLKKYNVGVLVGTPTRGWGTVERVFKMQNQVDPSETHSIFLVHSLTLREDGKPIEGNKVEPVIDLTRIGWEKELLKYFNSQEIIDAVKQVWKSE